MITNLLTQRTSLINVISGIDKLINELYRTTLPFKEGDEVLLNGSRGVIAEITYFSPIKVFLYRKDGELSKIHRIAKNISDIAVCYIPI